VSLIKEETFLLFRDRGFLYFSSLLCSAPPASAEIVSDINSLFPFSLSTGEIGKLVTSLFFSSPPRETSALPSLVRKIE